MSIVFGSEAALDEWSAIQQRIRDISFVFGSNSPEAEAATSSWAQCKQFISNNEGEIYRDGELSLLFVSFITCGIIWFESRKPEHEGMYVMPGEWSIHS